jgi:glycosyltransferase involved in cell wall biosynthesis
MCGSGPVPEAVRTIRSRDLLVSPLNWRRSSFGALKGEVEGAYASSPSALAGWVIPDLELIGWLPFALPRALKLANEEHFDCTITSSPPQSGHLIGLALRHRGIPWVADLRDGWSFEPSGERFPAGRRRQLDARLEQAVIARADAVVAVTPPIAEDLRQRVNHRAVTITNGYDPDEVAHARQAAARAPVAADRYTLAYTGTLRYGGASSMPLVEGFRTMREQDPEAAGQLEIVFAGPMAPADLMDLKAPDLDGTVRVLGPVSREQALGLQRAANALVLFADSRRPSIATGKLYEYLSSARPILVIGQNSVAARIVREVGAGLVVPADAPQDIAAALHRLLRGDTVPMPSQDALEQFSYVQLAARMADVVEQAIAARRS